MGIVLPFDPHARSSALSVVGCNSAKASKVMCKQPFSPAKRTISGHLFAGMKPRPRHVLTVEAGKPSLSETAPVPPRSSIVEPAVSDMGATIVRSLRTSQEFALRETTFPPGCDAMAPMDEPLHDPPERIAPRLLAVRLGMNIRNPNSFCDRARNREKHL